MSTNTARIAASITIIILFLLLRLPLIKLLKMTVGRITSHSNSEPGEQILSAIELPVRFIFMAAGIWIAFDLLTLPSGLKSFIDHMMRSLIAFLVFWMAYRASDSIPVFLQKHSGKNEGKADDMLIPFFKNGIKVAIVILETILIAQEWGYDVAGLLTGLGLGGLAFALAAKDTAANLFGSITIMLDRPFLIGDWILTSHVEGIVEDIGFRSTRVRTFGQALVTIPNSLMSAIPITNWSRMGKRKISFKLKLKYISNANQIKECIARIREILVKHPEVHEETAMVYFEGFGDNSIDIFIYFFTRATDWQKYLEVQEDINFKIIGTLELLGIPLILVPAQKNSKDQS